MKIINKFVNFLQIPRAILHLFLYYFSPIRSVIEIDIKRWLKETGLEEQVKNTNWIGLVFLLWKSTAFRNLFYYRITNKGGIISRIVVEFSKLFYWPMNTLFIYTPEIGPGLYIQHGFSTIIAAKSIGHNCWINQQVTIGYTNMTDTPTIGNNVRITAGAKVLGNIKIGDNSVIGANAVVVKDVPSDCTVVGVPAYIVKLNGKKLNKPL